MNILQNERIIHGGNHAHCPFIHVHVVQRLASVGTTDDNPDEQVPGAEEGNHAVEAVVGSVVPYDGGVGRLLGRCLHHHDICVCVVERGGKVGMGKNASRSIRSIALTLLLLHSA